MRHWAMGMGIVAALAAGLAGCESDSPPEESRQYDPSVDAAPTNLAVRPNPDLLADQGRLAREYENLKATSTSGPATAGPTTGPAAEDAAIAAVRKVAAQMVQESRAGELSKVFEHFTDEDRVMLNDTIQALSALGPAVEEFRKVVTDRLNMAEPPASLTQGMGRFSEGVPGLDALAQAAPDSLTFKRDGTAVVVTGKGVNLRFVPVGEAWKIKADPTGAKMMAAMAGLVKAQTTLMKNLTAGIQGGQINEHNLDEQGMQMLETLVKPELEKVTQLIGELVKEGLGGTETPSPAPEPAPAP